MAAIVDAAPFHGWDSDSIIVVAVSTLAVYNACELLLMIAARFKDWRSLLFISLVIATFGVLPYFLGFLLEYFEGAPYWLSMTLSTIGWVLLITGQAVVLYSRLGLIVSNARILKAVKWMIIVDAIIFHTSTTVVQYGKVYAHGGHAHAFARALFYIEKIQMTGKLEHP